MHPAGPRRVMQVMTCALGCQGLLGMAAAASPFSRVTVDRSPAEEHRSVALRNSAAPRLDLSLPAAVPAAATSGPVGAVNSTAQARAATAVGDEGFATQPAWGGLAPRLQSMTRLQELVRNERREGIPLARLWQSHGAALNLGVSPKGKPGLWFVKAVP